MAGLSERNLDVRGGLGSSYHDISGWIAQSYQHPLDYQDF